MRIPIISNIVDAITGTPQETQDDSMYIPQSIQLPDPSHYSSPEFAEPFYRDAQLNMKVESKEEMINALNASHLNWNCKQAFKGLIETYFDTNILLSDLTGKKVTQKNSSDEQVQIAYWRAMISVIGLVRVSSGKFDRRKPEFVNFERRLLEQAWFRFKRAKGPDRERIIKGKIQIKNETSQEISQRRDYK